MKLKASHCFGLLSFFALSCSPSPDPEDSNESTSTKSPRCKAHDDCEADEICFFDGLCAKPTGSYFELTKCSFDGPDKHSFPNCWIQCNLMNVADGPARWSFSSQKWDECANENRLRASDLGREVRCGFIPEEEGVTCPDIGEYLKLCISEDCPGFRMEHYRSERFVELRSESGYSLKFLLEPVKD